MHKLKFVGLDGEMSGSNIDEGAALIQIGFSIWKGDTPEMFHLTMNPGEMTWNEEAEAVHKIPKSNVLKSLHAHEVDKLAYAWLSDNGLRPEDKSTQIGVGFNVGSFDMPFVRKYLPKVATLFSRRTVDLNALLFALHGKNGLDSLEYKKQAKDYAIQKIGGIGLEEHNAGYDSLLHLYAFQYISRLILGVNQ